MADKLTKPTLTKPQAMKLCEEIRASFEGVAEKIYALHEGQGWTVLGYVTWKECVEKEFHHSAWWGKNQIRIAEVKKTLPPCPPKIGGKGRVAMQPESTPHNDRILTALADIPEDQREAVLEWAAEKADGKPLTAAIIKSAWKDMLDQEPDEEEEEPAEPTIEEKMAESNSRLESFARQITGLFKAAKELAEPHLDGAGRLEILESQLKSAANTVRAAKGAGTCPYCDGKGCKHCLKTGWVNKPTLESAPERKA